jgi:hypothetical protein
MVTNNHRSIADDFEAAQARTIVELGEWFNERCRQEIESPEWTYPTNPKIRDIVSTGRLRDSAVLRLLPDGGFEITWEADYSTEVHEGGTSPEGVRFPGRPWTRDPIAELPAMYAQLLAKNLKAQKSS